MPRNGQLDVVSAKVAGFENAFGLGEEVDLTENELAAHRLANDWLETSRWISITARLNLQFVKDQIPNGRILDVGAGNGVMTHLLADAYPRATFFGCDTVSAGQKMEYAISKVPGAIDELMKAVRQQLLGIEDLCVPSSAKSKRAQMAKNITFVSQPLGGWIPAHTPNIPVASSGFDAAVSFQVLHDVDDPDGYFQEIRRLLKTSKGKFFMSVASPYNPIISKSMKALLPHKFDDSALGVETLEHQLCKEDLLAEYLQRLILMAAHHGFEVKRIARSPMSRVRKVDETFPDELADIDRFNQDYGDRLPAGGFEELVSGTRPTVFFVEFCTKELEKVAIPKPDAWIPFVNGIIPARNVGRGVDGLNIEILPTIARGSMVCNGAGAQR